MLHLHNNNKSCNIYNYRKCDLASGTMQKVPTLNVLLLTHARLYAWGLTQRTAGVVASPWTCVREVYRPVSAEVWSSVPQSFQASVGTIIRLGYDHLLQYPFQLMQF